MNSRCGGRRDDAALVAVKAGLAGHGAQRGARESCLTVNGPPDLIALSGGHEEVGAAVDDILRRSARDEHTRAEDLRETRQAVFRVRALRRRNHRRPNGLRSKDPGRKHSKARECANQRAWHHLSTNSPSGDGACVISHRLPSGSVSRKLFSPHGWSFGGPLSWCANRSRSTSSVANASSTSATVSPAALPFLDAPASKDAADAPTGLKNAMRNFEGSTNSENISFSKAGATPKASAKKCVIAGTSAVARTR